MGQCSTINSGRTATGRMKINVDISVQRPWREVEHAGDKAQQAVAHRVPNLRQQIVSAVLRTLISGSNHEVHEVLNNSGHIE
jgi:hypothetical protein